MNKDNARWNLEELLQLKRAEEPTEAFWDRFDTQLQARLEEESVLVFSPIKEIFARLWKQWMPITASCVLALALSLSYLSKNNGQRFVAFQPITSIESCQASRLQANDEAPVISSKSVICKKMIASAAPNCFSF